MNGIWLFIILISLLFSIYSGNVSDVINNIFSVPAKTIDSLITIGSVLIIYSGLFKIAVKLKIIDKVAIVFRGIVEKIFGYKKGETLNNLISTSIIANMLGLGAVNTTIAIQIINEMKKESKEVNKNMTMYLLINISSFTVLPLSLLSLRESYSANINLLFIPILIVCSFFTTLFSIFIVKVFVK